MSGAGQAFDISQVLVSEEVRQIRREGWTGVLALAQGDIAKGLYFIDGEVVFEYGEPRLDENDPDARAWIERRGGETELTGGTISLQAESHPCAFRNIELMVLEPR